MSLPVQVEIEPSFRPEFLAVLGRALRLPGETRADDNWTLEALARSALRGQEEQYPRKAGCREWTIPCPGSDHELDVVVSVNSVSGLVLSLLLERPDSNLVISNDGPVVDVAYLHDPHDKFRRALSLTPGYAQQTTVVITQAVQAFLDEPQP